MLLCSLEVIKKQAADDKIKQPEKSSLENWPVPGQTYVLYLGECTISFRMCMKQRHECGVVFFR